MSERTDFAASADVYDVIYRDKDYAGEVHWIVERLRELGITDGRWLDVGCGTGRHLAEVPAQFERHGIDRSEGMLAAARRRLPDAQLEVGDATAFAGADYDVVSAIFAVASYLAEPRELDRFLAAAAAALRPGGILYFDVWHGGAVLSQGPEQRWQRYPTEDGEVIRLSRPEHDPSTSRVDVLYTYIWIRGDRVVLNAQERHRVRYYLPLELREACSRHGLDVLALCPFLEHQRAVTVDDWSVAVFARSSAEGKG